MNIQDKLKKDYFVSISNFADYFGLRVDYVKNLILQKKLNKKAYIINKHRYFVSLKYTKEILDAYNKNHKLMKDKEKKLEIQKETLKNLKSLIKEK